MHQIRLPRKITPCPIFEAILEIRFLSTAPGDAIFGMMYEQFGKEYPIVQRDAVLQIPESIRIIDPGLMYRTEYRLSKGTSMLLVGRRVFGYAVIGNYPGWTSVSTTFCETMKKLQDLNFISDVTRLGIRYINVFDFDVFKKLKLKLVLNGDQLPTNSTQIVADVSESHRMQTLRIANGTIVRREAERIGESVIDIDIGMEVGLDKFFENVEPLIDTAHEAEKQLFFQLLDEVYLTSLNPEYD